MNWFDILLLAVFLLHLANGLARGFLKQFFDLFGFIIAVAVSLWGSRYFSVYLAGYLNPEAIVPQHDILLLFGAEELIEKVTLLVAAAIAFLLLLIVLTIAFKLFSGGFQWANRIPVVGPFNRLAGAVLGAAAGIFFVYLIITVFSIIPMPFFIEAVDKSEIAFLASHYLSQMALILRELMLTVFLALNGSPGLAL